MSIATKFWTWTELKAEVQDELDLEDDSFISSEELLKYANRAIDRAEQLVHTIHEGYFLARATISLVDGTEEYSPPADIYAMKFKALIYHNGTTVFPIIREKDPDKLLTYRVNKEYGTSTDGQYRYFIINETAGSWKILLTPTPNVTGDYVEAWYLRQANRLATGTDVLDIPEAGNFVVAYMIYRAIKKDTRGNPTPELEVAKLDLGREEAELVATLTNLTVDGDNEIPPDLTHYQEHS